jgi:hypothetical protein
MPKLVSYPVNIVKKPELTTLEPAVLLFHEGYLSVDAISETSVVNPVTEENDSELHYSFRFPNYEVRSSYMRKCFNCVFELEGDDDFDKKGQELKEAFLAKDDKKVSDLFNAIFAIVKFTWSFLEDKNFQSFVESILVALEFYAFSEVDGGDGRQTIIIKFPNDIYLIMDIKHCPRQTKISAGYKENEALAIKAALGLPQYIVNSALSKAVQAKLLCEGKTEKFSNFSLWSSSQAETDRLLTDNAKTVLSYDEYYDTLSRLAKDAFPSADIKAFLLNAQKSFSVNISDEEIEDVLSKAANDALHQIAVNDYPEVVKLNANKIIVMGLAVYGDGKSVKAIFG